MSGRSKSDDKWDQMVLYEHGWEASNWEWMDDRPTLRKVKRYTPWLDRWMPQTSTTAMPEEKFDEGEEDKDAMPENMDGTAPESAGEASTNATQHIQQASITVPIAGDSACSTYGAAAAPAMTRSGRFHP